MLEPAGSIRFDSWQQFFDWLPRASEAELMTAFVWAADQDRVPPDQRDQLERARRSAFEELVRRCRDRLRSYLVNRLGVRDVHQAEDIIQETLLLVYTRAEQFDPQRSFWGWLYRIAHNKQIDLVRRQRPGHVGSGGPSEGELDDQMKNLIASTAAPDAAALVEERGQRLEAIISKLPAPQRRIVQRKREGAKGIDIARELGKSPAYVSQAFHEAVEVIRDQLGE